MTAAFISSLKLKALKILKTPLHYPCSSSATLRRDNADPASHEITYTSGVQCLNDWLQTTEFSFALMSTQSILTLIFAVKKK